MNNQFIPAPSTTTPYYGPQSYVNFTMPNNTPIHNNGVFTKFVDNEQEAINAPNPVNGCDFYMDGERLLLYVKYSDGRPMETYTLTLKEPPAPPKPLTAEELNDILDRRFDELSKRFVMRKDGANKNGQ